MKIQVCIDKNDKNQKKRGDLLEKISKEFLERLNFKVENEVRQTAVEIDLLCQSNVNQRKICVECKAHKDNIQSDVIYKMLGIKQHHKKYSEIWLITTSELGKEAKGLIEEISNGKDSDSFCFYTPKEFLNA